MSRIFLSGLVILLSAIGAQAQLSWTGSVLEIDCAGVESVGGTVAKERYCMEIVASQVFGQPFLCTQTARDDGLCPPSIPEDRDFRQVRMQGCTDRDIPGDRSRCLYGRGEDTFAVASCTAKNKPVSCCTGSGTGTCPALPTCDAAEWGHVSRDLDTGADSWCNGSTWGAVTTQEPGEWHPALFEGANRVTVAGLSTCNAANEGLAEIVTDGTGAADCSVGLGSNVHRCRCLSTVWTAETGEYRIWPPSGTLFGVDAVGDLPPCTASAPPAGTNNVRAWVGPFGDPLRPWLDGTLYRCSSLAWAANVGNYRIGENDDGIGDVARPWCRDENCWFTAPPDAVSSWIEDQGQDFIRRFEQNVLDRKRDSGQRKIRSQQESTESN